MIFCFVHTWEEADINDNERDCISAVNNYDSSSETNQTKQVTVNVVKIVYEKEKKNDQNMEEENN